MIDYLKDNIVAAKSYTFALRCIKLYRYLCDNKREFVLSKQLLRSGTSIGANIWEGVQGQSKADFAHKMNIALKEANETHYWLHLLRDAEFLSVRESESIINDCEELLKLLTSIVSTTKKNENNG